MMKELNPILLIWSYPILFIWCVAITAMLLTDKPPVYENIEIEGAYSILTIGGMEYGAFGVPSYLDSLDWTFNDTTYVLMVNGAKGMRAEFQLIELGDIAR